MLNFSSQWREKNTNQPNVTNLITLEFHFLFICTVYTNLRRNWLERVIITTEHLHLLPNGEKCRIMLRAQNVKFAAQVILGSFDLRIEKGKRKILKYRVRQRGSLLTHSACTLFSFSTPQKFDPKIVDPPIILTPPKF